MKVPCYKCGERQVGCHSMCEKYKAYVIEKDERNRKIREAKNGVYYAEIEAKSKKNTAR